MKSRVPVFFFVDIQRNPCKNLIAYLADIDSFMDHNSTNLVY